MQRLVLQKRKNRNYTGITKYYLDNKREFLGEDGHEKLLIGLKKFIKPESGGSTVVGLDVGCCVGDYISNLEEICNEDNKKILCFEPNPVNISKLEPLIADRENIKLLKHCVSNETSNASLFNWKNSKSNDSGNGVAGLRSGGEKICDVLVKKLDDVLDEEFKDKDILIKFAKIDTEGNDTNVIKGFKKYLSKTKYLIFECSNCLDDIRGPGIKNPMKEIVDLLSEYGFNTYRIGTKKLFQVNDEHWNPIYEEVKFWSNCFALKKDDMIIKDLINQDFDYLF